MLQTLAGVNPWLHYLLVRLCAPALQLSLQLDALQMKACLYFLLGLYLLLSNHTGPGSCFQRLPLFAHALLCLGQVLVYMEQLPEESSALELLLQTPKHRSGYCCCQLTDFAAPWLVCNLFGH